ncbi:MAG: ribonuclease E inhibitor RraB [Verrucomicrobiota bacterium]|nr:ribonuclease E inhibitor RraB [Verrucomicrobiota bacterium]
MRKLTFIIMISIFSFLFGSAHASNASGSSETKEELAVRLKKDREVLKALANAGSDLSKPHEIEFHFVGYDEAKISAVSTEGKQMGYRVSKIDSLTDKKGQKYWYFDLIQSVVPSEKNVFSHSAVMTALGKKYDVEFDGWGCLIVE